MALELQQPKKVQWLYVTCCQYSAARAAAFATEVQELDWEDFAHLEGSNILANVIDDAFNDLYNKHFSIVTTKVLANHFTSIKH